MTTKQERYVTRVTRKGLIKVCVWVPTEAREHVIKLANKLRALAKKEKT